MKTIGLLVGAVVFFSCEGFVRAADPVIVHEWGTFTSLQDEHGNAIGGINVDDEPVPNFVYDFGGVHSTESSSFGLPPYANLSKGWQADDADVTMRLETPVLYIYPPKGEAPASVPPLEVHVDFHGGVLSQFYPWADWGCQPGGPRAIPNQPLAGITSSLDWKSVRLGSTGAPVQTADKVWTTPRETSAPLLEVPPPNDAMPTQVEHFLFYRGVGHVDSPLCLGRDPFNVGEKGKISLCPNWVNRTSGHPTPAGDIALNAQYEGGWLAEIHSDGSCAFRAVPPFEEGVRTRIHPFTKVAFEFGPIDFSRNNLAELKASMRAALVKEGLYPDEASAMLRTWEVSYFKSPGLRFFYIVPRKWVDEVLPLKITGAPVEITRVMVGRIELISDDEKAALARLAAGPYPDLAGLKEEAHDVLVSGRFSVQQQQDYYTGARPLTDLGISLSPSVRDYLSLGRFRDALVVHEQQQHPSDNLARFIQENGLASAQ